jgi:nucleoside-diphosphate-sugar epimerase
MSESALSAAGGAAARSAEDTVLVTGGAGFLGSRVVRMLSDEARYHVLATDIASSPKSDALAQLPNVEFRAMDLRDRDSLGDAVRSVGNIVHLAAVRLRASQAQPRQGFEVNVSATFDLLTMAADNGIRAFVYGSSQQLYGTFPDPDHPPFREEDGAVGPDVSLYGAAKLASEAFLAPFSVVGGFSYLALRFGGIYGPDAAEKSNSWAMLEALRAIDAGESVRIPWSKDSLHALVFVEDAARAVVRALELPLCNVAVNVTGDPVSSDELYSTLTRLYGADTASLEFSAERSRYQRVDQSRLRTGFGLRGATPLETGLQSIVDWHCASR